MKLTGKRRIKLFCKTSEATPEQITCYQKIFFLLVLAISLVTILTTGNPLFSKQSAEAMLKEFSVRIVQYGMETGSDFNFTHGDVEMFGAGYNKSAVVMNPSLSFSRAAWLGPDVLNFSTSRMIMTPAPSGNGQVMVEFPEPLIFSTNGTATHSLTFEPGPMRYVTMKRKIGDAVEYLHSLQLPEKVNVAPLASGTKPFTLAYGRNPKIDFTFTPLTGTSQSMLAFQNIVVADEAGVMNVSSFSAQVARSLVGPSRLRFDTGIIVDGVNFTHGDVKEGPYSFKASLYGTRVIGSRGELPPPDTDITVRELSLSAGAFSLSANGKVKRTQDDSLPYGTGRIQVKNFASLQGNPVLSPEVKTALVEGLNRVVTPEAAAKENVEFDIKREKLGQFTIGSASFEDLAAIFIKRVLLRIADQPQPVVLEPAADTPAPADGAAASATPEAAPAAASEAPAASAPAAPVEPPASNTSQ